MHINKIIFYNHHQHGDLALSKSLVNWIVNNFPEQFKIPFYFAMKKNVKSIFFNSQIINIKFEDCPNHNWMRSDFLNKVSYFDGSLWINTWIWSSPTFRENIDSNCKNASGYRTDWKIEHSFTHCLEILNIINSDKRIPFNIKLPQKELDLYPRANFSPPHKDKVDKFINTIRSFNKKILICNGPVYSLQTPNFSIRDQIEPFVKEHPNIAFIYTDKSFIPYNNEFFIDDYCEVPNLNEIDYLSTLCDILIIRRSGPGEVIQTYENFSNLNKTIISLYDWEEGKFYLPQMGAKLKWTNNYNSDSIINLLKD